MSLENATQTFGPQRILSQNDQVPVETEVSVVAICKPKMNNTKAITVKGMNA